MTLICGLVLNKIGLYGIDRMRLFEMPCDGCPTDRKELETEK
jgi:hypothetical protein